MKKPFIDIITRKLTVIFMVSILAGSILFLVIYQFASNYIYNKTMGLVAYMVEDFIYETDEKLNRVEAFYGETLKSGIKTFSLSEYQEKGALYLEEYTQELARRLKKEKVEEIKLWMLHYYMINPEGIITQTNYSPDLGRNLFKYPILRQQLQSIKEGEILIPNISQELSTNRLRLYAYYKLPNGEIFELGLLFDQEYFLQLKEKTKKLIENNPYIANIDFFNWHYFSYLNGDRLPSNEREFFQPTQNDTYVMKEVSISPFKKVYYVTLHDQAQTKYIKLTFDYFLLRYLFMIISASLIMLFMILFFIRSSILREINRAFNPFRALLNEVETFAVTKEMNNRSLLSNTSNITEVDDFVQGYKKMAEEITLAFKEISAMNLELEEAYTENDNLLNKLSIILELIRQMPSDISREEFLLQVYEVAIKFIPEGDYASMSIVKGDRWEYIAAKGHDFDKLKSLSLKADYLLDIDQVQVVENLEDINNSYLPEEISKGIAQASKPIQYSLFCPFKTEKQWYGNLSVDIDRNSEKEFSQESIKFMEQLSNIVTGFLVIKESKQVETEFRNGIIFSFIKALELYDKYTEGHSQSVAELAAKIAKKMGLSEERVNTAYWGGLLHDIGKILIDKDILNKKGSLTKEEYDEIKKHAVYGYDILVQTKEMKDLANVIRHHHERWDGKGYPDGLKGEEIPLESRIIALVDAWDTMLNRRLYRKPLTLDEAVEEIQANKETQFDPTIADVLLEIVEG